MGVQEAIIIAAILVVLLVLPGRFPSMARSVADGLKEFRRAGKELHDGRQ